MQGLKAQVRKMQFRNMTRSFNSGMGSHWNRLSRERLLIFQCSDKSGLEASMKDVV